MVDKFFSSDPEVSRSVQSLYERRLHEARRLLDNLHLVRSRCESSRNHFVRVERDIREERKRVEEDLRMRFEALKRRLEDMLEVSLRQLDSRERELLDPVEEGNVAVDELYREIERVSDNLQLKFQVEAKSEFIHNFHLIQKDVDRVMAANCPQVRLPNLSYLCHELAFSQVQVITDGSGDAGKDGRGSLLLPGEALLRDKERHLFQDRRTGTRDASEVAPSDTASSVASYGTSDGKKRRKRRSSRRYEESSKDELVRLLTKSCKELMQQNHILISNLAAAKGSSAYHVPQSGPETIGRSLDPRDDARRGEELARQQRAESERISRELAENLRRTYPPVRPAPRDRASVGEGSMASDYTGPGSVRSIGDVEDQIHSLISEATSFSRASRSPTQDSPLSGQGSGASGSSYSRTHTDGLGVGSYTTASRSIHSSEYTQPSRSRTEHSRYGSDPSIGLPNSELSSRYSHSRVSSLLSGSSHGSDPSVQPTFRENSGHRQQQRTLDSDELSGMLSQARSGRYTPGSVR